MNRFQSLQTGFYIALLQGFEKHAGEISDCVTRLGIKTSTAHLVDCLSKKPGYIVHVPELSIRYFGVRRNSMVSLATSPAQFLELFGVGVKETEAILYGRRSTARTSLRIG